MKPYRAIPINGKDFVYGYYFAVGPKNNISHYILPHEDAVWVAKVFSRNEDSDFITGFIEVIPETVGQATGLQDKNGKEIYEGDIVIYKIYMTARQKFPVQRMIWIWSEYHCGFSMKVIGGDRYVPPVMIPDEHEIEIIGNIHTTPNLMEAKDV